MESIPLFIVVGIPLARDQTLLRAAATQAQGREVADQVKSECVPGSVKLYECVVGGAVTELPLA